MPPTPAGGRARPARGRPVSDGTPAQPSVPPDLRQWIDTHLPGVHEITDVSWSRESSRVWRVATTAAAAFVKLSPTVRDYDREVAGYAYAARVLTDHEAPRLAAADPDLLAIMSTPLPGKVVRGLRLDVAEERRVHELAGRLLRRWHDHSDPATEHDRQVLHAAMAQHAREAADCLTSTTAHLDQTQRALVTAASQELTQLAEQLPVIYKHGDYSTRNWLWDTHTSNGDGDGHGLIDFAMAEHGVAVDEFVWLSGAVWASRPDLRAAYLTGYGRPLSPVEERLLRLLTTRLGVSYLTAGLEQNRPDLVDRGHLILTRMTHDHHSPP